MRFPSARRSRESGSIMVLFTLILPTLIVPMAGLAIDATVARLVQLRLQAAVDGAALGAGRLLGTDADPETVAGEFLTANFRTDHSAATWNAHDLTSTIHYTPGITKRIDIDARAQVPLLFMRIFGVTDATVTAAGASTRTDTRVVIVIDRSGSMDADDGTGLGHTTLFDAISDAQGFTKKFTESADELGLVVFGGSAVVLYPAKNPSWDPSTTSGSTGGPDAVFNDPANVHNMVQQLAAVDTVVNMASTNTSEALWLAYIELQKAHLKDLAADGHDYRLNSIVLLTDGLPQAVSVWPNNPKDHTAVNPVIKTTSLCDNQITALVPSPTSMRGWVSVPRNGLTFVGQRPSGLYQFASTDPTATHDSVWWASRGVADTVDLIPRPTFANPDDNKCGGFRKANSTAKPPYTVPHPASEDPTPSTTFYNATDLHRIPYIDAYGSDMTCPGGNCAYQVPLASQFVDALGNVVTNPLPVGLTYDPTQVTLGEHWVLAAWNATDSAAKRIRADVNMPNRLPPDTQKMKIAIHVIGYSGSAPGLDQGLLLRISNAKASTSYDSTQEAGIYVRAGNPAALAAAWNTIFEGIMRLAR